MSNETDGVYRACQRLVRVMIRLFFREVVVEGLENLPTDRGGLLIAGHPNGLIDPALIMAHFPGRIVFGARHGLFEWPLIGRILKRLGTIPIYRASDESRLSGVERKNANENSLDGLARELAQGSFSALFPEGLSHDLPHLSEIKTGAARLYYRARALNAENSPEPIVIPVGLHYDRKNVFRSRVLVSFQPCVQLPPELDLNPGDDHSALRDAVKGLTALIDRQLTVVIGATDDWQIHHLMNRARKLVRADLAHRNGMDYRDPSLAESRLGYSRIWQGYQARKDTDPERLADFRRRLTRYDRKLILLGVDDHELTVKSRMASPLLISLFLAQAVAVYLLFPPVLVLGVLINVGPYFLLKWFTRRVSQARKDEASVKLLGGAVLFPLVWAIAAVAAWFAHEQVRALFPAMPDLAVLVVLLTVAIGVFGGYLALIYSELSAETFRAVRVRVLRRRRQALVRELIEERSSLCSELLALGEGLDLPGIRLPDGSLLKKPAQEEP
ncbi:MAG: glycerol-3-phosphate O-acyltransferase/dihydroxyacetone phosphate acyltransferase [Rhodothermales bacterium]|jgi:glycerol-3-phosphate O-acyltransferase/dihydroxyacetone phosphate acyltransferase